MNAHRIIAQAQQCLPDLPIVRVQALLQEFLATVNNVGKSEFVDVLDIPDDTYYTLIPTNVKTVHKAYYSLYDTTNLVYLKGDPVGMDYTEEEYQYQSDRLNLSKRAYVGQDRIMYMNFAVNTASSNNKLILKATIRTSFTLTTLDEGYELPALYFVLYRLYMNPYYKDPAQAKNYYSMFNDAYMDIIHTSPGEAFRNLGSDL